MNALWPRLRVPRRANRWAERTVTELANTARDMAIQERWARHDGLLQRRDARAKWVSVLLLLVASGLAHHTLCLLAVCALALLLAWESGIPVGLLLRRMGTLLLPFAVASLLFALLNRQFGAVQAVRLFLRAAVSVSLVLLLVLTTRWQSLMRGLGGLGVPPLFVAVLESAHRHLFLLPVIALEMFQARRARTVGVASLGEARRFVGFSIGALLGKTHALAENTHDAMCARGYVTSNYGTRGPVSSMSPPWQGMDLLLTLGALAISALLLLGDHLLGTSAPF